MNNKYLIALVVGILVIGGGVYFLKSDSTLESSSNKETSSKTTSKKNLPPVPPEIIHNVSIVGSAFIPASIIVKKGETIVWTNKDSTPHTVTGGDMQSLSLGQNQTYSFVYDKTGTFSYHCSLHPSAKGTVIVTD